MPQIPGAMDVSCGNCGAHYQLDPSGDMAGAACDSCGGTRFFRSQPSPTQSDGTLRNMVDSDTQIDQGGNPLGEGTIMGTDGERPMGKRDNYMHSKIAMSPYEQLAELRRGLPADQQHRVEEMLRHEGLTTTMQYLQGLPHPPPADHGNPIWDALQPFSSVTERIEPMRTFNMEPYAPLWDESYLPAKTAGPLAEVGGAALSMLPRALPTLMRGALGMGAIHALEGGGQQAGGMAPEQPDPAPTPAPNMGMLSSVDIPFVLVADYDTPHSVKSVGEQHDDPQNQDQKEFNDGDQSPKNLKNPNLEDSGADGEDGVRDATDGYGIGDNSPSAERAMMILPLLLHYFQSDESGQSDPLIRALHESLEKESPGYLDKEDPEGQKHVELIIQQHGQPHAPPRQAGVNALPGGLPATPMPGMGMEGPGGGTCPNCGGVLAGDGSCPQCGSKQHPQGGMMTGDGAGMSGGPSYPPNRVGTSGAGPQTPEQKAAVIQLLEQQSRQGEIPMVELEPWRFAQELAEIQGQPNVAPLVDPSQAQPTPAPMQAMPNAPGAMPVPDPSQAGGGMGMPMQPMARSATQDKTADANNSVPRCPHCGTATTSVTDGIDGDGEYKGRCHNCQKTFPLHESRVVLADLMNPALENAAEKHEERPETTQDSTLTWQDSNGQQLIEGGVYELVTPGYTQPDYVKVVGPPKPDQLNLKLVGVPAGIPGTEDDMTPDFSITPQDMHMYKYMFKPADEPESTDGTQPTPLGGMPGLEQIPQQPATTDELSSSYPNKGTMASVLAADAIDERYDELCHKCGCDWVTHTASSEITTMHECARCGTAWETSDEYQGRQASVDLDWLRKAPQGDDFHSEMERARSMHEYTQQSRNLSAVAAQDNRLQVVRDVLSRNKGEREQRTAGRHFTPSEQRELINERGTARNLEDLDLSNTHYETRYDSSGKANGMNAPDAHLVLGL